MAIANFLNSMGLVGETEVSHQLESRQSKFGLLIGAGSGVDQLLSLVAYLALAGPVRVLDAGNHFDLIAVAYQIRRATPDLFTSADRVEVVRAFTCIEVVKGLEEMQAGAPVVIFDLLATFYDDAVNHVHSRLLVERGLGAIERLKAGAPVVASVRDDCPKDSPRAGLLPILRAGADVVHEQTQSEDVLQPRMI